MGKNTFLRRYLQSNYQYTHFSPSSNTIFAIFGAQQGIKLGGPGIGGGQRAQFFFMRGQSPPPTRIPSTKSHPSAEDSRAWHSKFQLPDSHILAAGHLYLYRGGAHENEF